MNWLKRSLSWLAALTLAAVSSATVVQPVAASSAMTPTAGSPFSSIAEFISDLPNNGTFGPMGLLNDGSHFYVSDYSNAVMYRFPLAGGSGLTPDLAVANGINSGLAVALGVYYGAAQPFGTPLSPGLYTFDPGTLEETGQVATFPGAFFVRQVIPDPLNAHHIYVSTNVGIFVVDTSVAPAAVATFGPAGDYDGMQFTGDGSTLYVASAAGTFVVGFDRNGVQQLLVSQGLCCGTDGIAVARPNTILGNGVDVSNNVFVNMNDGTIRRIDVNNANQVSLVAAGGSRGDFILVGPDGSLYVTQTDDVLKLSPPVFQPQDTTPPAITCAAPDASWHGSDVSLPCTATDSQSGLANPADASFSLSTSVPPGAETANAQTGSHSVCDLAGNCATAGPIGGIMVDKKAPVITITAPASAVYTLNQAVAASYACSDGGSGVATCAGPVPSGSPVATSAVGTQVFTVQSTDNVGNLSTAGVSYTVSFGICALYDQNVAMTAGSVRPIKLELCDANGGDASASAITVHAVGVTLLSTQASSNVVAAGNANPDNDFRFDPTLGTAGGYVYNLSTKGLGTGTYQLAFTATGDPTLHFVQFELR